jgi:hypothetical protein
MDNEFIIMDDDNKKSKWKSITYILIIIIIVLIIAILLNRYGSTCAAYFQGSFPERSDVGSDKFDLEKEVNFLSQKQMNNLSKS